MIAGESQTNQQIKSRRVTHQIVIHIDQLYLIDRDEHVADLQFRILGHRIRIDLLDENTWVEERNR